MSIAKEEARQLLDAIPEDATWDDIIYQFHVRKKVDAGIEAAEAGRVVPQEEVEKRFPLE
jgi:predicted transcriptional regulator